MFKQTTITVTNGIRLANLISSILDGFDIIPFQLSWRLNRQLKELNPLEKKIAQAKVDALTELVGEEKFRELAEANTHLSEALNEEQMKAYDEVMGGELSSEVTVGLLSESFESFIGNAELEATLANTVVAVLGFYEDTVWNPVTEE